jgi:hypothetical protein
MAGTSATTPNSLRWKWVKPPPQCISATSSLAEATNTLPVFRLRAMGSHLVSEYGQNDASAATPLKAENAGANERQCSG